MNDTPAVSDLKSNTGDIAADKKSAVTIIHESADILHYEDGTVWNNPDYENWFKEYAGKETDIDELQNYYPYEYEIVTGKN